MKQIFLTLQDVLLTYTNLSEPERKMKVACSQFEIKSKLAEGMLIFSVVEIIMWRIM